MFELVLTFLDAEVRSFPYLGRRTRELLTHDPLPPDWPRHRPAVPPGLPCRPPDGVGATPGAGVAYQPGRREGSGDVGPTAPAYIKGRERSRKEKSREDGECLGGTVTCHLSHSSTTTGRLSYRGTSGLQSRFTTPVSERCLDAAVWGTFGPRLPFVPDVFGYLHTSSQLCMRIQVFLWKLSPGKARSSEQDMEHTATHMPWLPTHSPLQTERIVWHMLPSKGSHCRELIVVTFIIHRPKYLDDFYDEAASVRGKHGRQQQAEEEKGCPPGSLHTLEPGPARLLSPGALERDYLRDDTHVVRKCLLRDVSNTRRPASCPPLFCQSPVSTSWWYRDIRTTTTRGDPRIYGDHALSSGSAFPTAYQRDHLLWDMATKATYDPLLIESRAS
ncbi:hypothetical protein Bbelb_264750 [Branchiostoma belcheri]|nr:hypothetical protein Bbelb_264750 [Branchiostoma belcheri]